METPSFSEQHPPTFGDMLFLVLRGEAQGFTVFKDGDIGYVVYEPGEEIDPPEEGEVRVPMTPEEAQAMIDELMAFSPEELLEIGRLDDDPSSWN